MEDDEVPYDPRPPLIKDGSKPAWLPRQRRRRPTVDTDEPLLTVDEARDLERSALPQPAASGGAGMWQVVAGVVGSVIQSILVTQFLLVWTDQLMLLIVVLVSCAMALKGLRDAIHAAFGCCEGTGKADSLIMFMLDVMVWTALLSTLQLVGLLCADFTVSSPVHTTLVLFQIFGLVTVMLAWVAGTFADLTGNI